MAHSKKEIIANPQIGDKLESRKSLGNVGGVHSIVTITAIGKTGAVHSELQTTRVDAYGVTHIGAPSKMPIHRAHVWRNNGDCIHWGFEPID